MKLHIQRAEQDGPILVCDEGYNDIAEFYHSDESSVGQSYETALSLSADFIKSHELLQAVDEAAVAIHGLLESPGEKDEWDSIRDLLPRLQKLLEAPALKDRPGDAL